MTTTNPPTKWTTKAVRSGFCGLSASPDSHYRCHMRECNCDCHTEQRAQYDPVPEDAPTARRWASAACLAGNPDACPITNASDGRPCANPVHQDTEPVMGDLNVDPNATADETDPGHEPVMSSMGDRDDENTQADPNPDPAPRRRRWKCPECEQLVYRSEHMLDADRMACEVLGTPDDLEPAGVQLGIPVTTDPSVPPNVIRFVDGQGVIVAEVPAPPDPATDVWDEIAQHAPAMIERGREAAADIMAMTDPTPDPGPRWPATSYAGRLDQEQRRRIIEAHLQHDPAALLTTVETILAEAVTAWSADG